MWTHDRLKPRDRTDQVGPWQRKLNGHRLTLFAQEDGTVLAFGRQVRPDLELGGRLRGVIPTRLPPLTMADGELCTASDRATDVRRGEGLRFVAFALPWLAGEWLGDEDPFVQEARLATLGLATVSCHVWRGHEHAAARVAEQGWEGYVIHERAYSGWWRWKPTRTIDATVIGLIPSLSPTHLGEVGSVRVAWPGGEGRCAGMSDADRRDARLGRVLEVEFQDTGSRGGLIHPRFLRWRDDL